MILPNVDRLPVATYEKVLAFARNGGIVIATRRLPATAPGLLHADEESARLKEMSQTLFHGNIASAHFVEDETQLGAELAKDASPDMTLSPRTPEIGFIHRKLPSGELYFVANTSNQPKRVEAQFRDVARHAEVWNAFTGEISGLPDPRNIELDLAPYESRLVFFSDSAMGASPQPDRRETMAADLAGPWKVTFGQAGPTVEMDRLASWSDDPKTQFYSGRATYEKTFDLPPEPLSQGTEFLIDFGPGTTEPLPSPPARTQHASLSRTSYS